MSRNKINTSNYVTIIGKNTTFNGNLECTGSVRVDGNLNGDINILGNLLICNEAIITGNIEALSVNVAGTIRGNILTKEFLKLQSKAHLEGDIKVKSFIVDQGAVFRGRCEVFEELAEPGKGKNSKKNRAAIADTAKNEASVSK